MKIIPFKAWRPASDEAAQQVICPPYDVISTNEARASGQGKPHSYLNVVRPEIQFPEGMDEYDSSVYDAGATALRALIASGLFICEETPSFYVYQLETDGRTSTGLFSGVYTSDYLSNKIIRHENTRPDKEDDRTRHIVTQRAHAEPVMLIHAKHMQLQSFFQTICENPPLLEVELLNVTHRIWKIADTREITEIFDDIPTLYVADGHHRCAAAARAAEQLADEHPTSAIFPAVIFSSEQMNVMAYNRLIYKAKASKIERMLQSAKVVSRGEDVPSAPGHVCVYYAGNWTTIELSPGSSDANPVERLDVQRLQDQILSPVFGIIDPRTDSNIAFVGGIRGTQKLQQLVDEGTADVAFSLCPTSVEELIAVSDAGLLMPPKSTWFEPKLASGLLVHVFE